MRPELLVVEQEDFNLRCLNDIPTEMLPSADCCSSVEANYRKPRNLVRPLDLLIIDLECIEDVDHSLFLKVPKSKVPQRQPTHHHLALLGRGKAHPIAR